jgi:hypothetical protein
MGHGKERAVESEWHTREERRQKPCRTAGEAAWPTGTWRAAGQAVPLLRRDRRWACDGRRAAARHRGLGEKATGADRWDGVDRNRNWIKIQRQIWALNFELNSNQNLRIWLIQRLTTTIRIQSEGLKFRDVTPSLLRHYSLGFEIIVNSQWWKKLWVSAKNILKHMEYQLIVFVSTDEPYSFVESKTSPKKAKPGWREGRGRS